MYKTLVMSSIIFGSYLYSQKITNTNQSYDIGIVGGGIIGCATARQLSIKYPDKKIILFEKDKLGSGQTSHNSGVIHAGIYYKPNSLKAKLCSTGSRMIFEFCDQNNIPYKKVGKLIVATNQQEEKTLLELYQRAKQNNCVVELLNSEQIKAIQPNCQGNLAIWSPNTAIINYQELAKSFVKDFTKSNILEDTQVVNIKKNNKIEIIYSNNNLFDRLFNKKIYYSF